MDDIHGNNFIDSVKGSQNTIYLSSVISITLYTLAQVGKVGIIKIPLIGAELEGVAGLTAVLLLFSTLGLLLWFQLSKAKDNIENVECNNKQKALLRHSSIVCSHLLVRVGSVVLPVVLFIFAMMEAYDNNIGQSFLMLAVFSWPYFAAASIVSELKYRDEEDE